MAESKTKSTIWPRQLITACAHKYRIGAILFHLLGSSWSLFVVVVHDYYHDDDDDDDDDYEQYIL